MGHRLTYGEMLGMLERSLAKLREHRKGDNTQYELRDAGFAAFSVFFMPSPSLLAYQRDTHFQATGKQPLRQPHPGHRH